MKITSLQLLQRGHTPSSELLFLEQWFSGGDFAHPPQEMLQQCLELFLIIMTGWVEPRDAAEPYNAQSDPVPNVRVEKPCFRDKEERWEKGMLWVFLCL